MQSPERINAFPSGLTSSNKQKDNGSNINNNNNNNNNNNLKHSLDTTMTISDGDHVLDMDMKKACEKSGKGFNNSTSSSSANDNNSSKEEEKAPSSEDEEMDEPDAMSSMDKRPDLDELHRNEIDQSFGKRFNGYNDSGDEDMEEDDRLVIDDEDAAAGRGQFSKSSPAPGNVLNQVFSCPQCHVVTTSAKAYLYHLDNVHNVRESGKVPLTSTDEDEDRMAMSNRPMNNDSAFLNLSIPIHSGNRSVSLSPKDDDDESSMNTTPAFSLGAKGLNSSMPVGITTDNIDQIFDDDKKKKKKTRQEVDPGKYFEAVDSSGTKYACSQCGNIYKWRKSLNKHWKEKHLNDPLAEVASPPGMLELLKSGKYTQLGSRRIYDNNFLQTIKAQKDDDISRTSTPSSEVMKSSTPTNFLDTSSHSLNTSDMAHSSPMPATLLPKMIGPFVASTAQPVFPGMGMALSHIALQNGFDPTSEEAMDLTRAAKNAMSTYQQLLASRNAVAAAAVAELNSSFDQDQPLDFSKKKEGASDTSIKSERPWEDSHSPSPMKLSNPDSPFTPKLHRCTKCDYSSMSEVDFANHTSSHYAKRACRCFECKMQLNSMEELNAHYIRDHNRKLTEYKEAIKKIPHGLQQTYHLLKMDLQSIGELNNQDLGSSDGKSLKCKKCDFEAKWPAELQKHAVSHSEERPYICMVCGSTYKWKWDLVKHFQKSHPALPNPYRRNDKRDTPDGSSEEETEDEPDIKRAKMSGSSSDIASGVSSPYNQDDMISVKGIMAATQAGQRFVSSQPNLDDDQPQSIEDSLALMHSYPYAAAAAAAFAAGAGSPVGLAQEFMERHQKAQKAIQDAIKSRQNASTMSAKSPSSGFGGSHGQSQSTSPVPFSSTQSSSSSCSSKGEQLPYKCTMCNYHARWPSEVTQHMKNHSDCKPYLCPRCDYRSKWKWDVVKHLKRCGGGTINDVIDTTKMKNNNSHNHNNNNNNSNNNNNTSKDTSPSNMVMSCGPPNAIVSQQGKVKKTTPQPLSYIVPSVDANGQQSALVVRSANASTSALEQILPAPSSHHTDSLAQVSKLASSSETIDLTVNNNNGEMANNNVNNNYASYSDGHPIVPRTSASPHLANTTPSTTDQMSHNTAMSSSTSPATATPLSAVSNPVTTTPTSSHRQNSSGEIWNCPHCPFSTQSQAELKRHSELHMDDKPFKCNECHYSTRWACDLKKHRKSYDHYPKNNNNNNNLVNKTNVETSKFQTKQKTVEDNVSAPAKKEIKGRFKCFQCSALFTSLENLVDHRKTTHIPTESSPTPQTIDIGEIDAARIKHPRKQIKQFTCPKCPFICKNRQTMDKHMEEHEQMERDSFQCFYCSSQYKDKESLLDHIVTHPAFNAKEWETFFMITEEEEEQTAGEEGMENGEIKPASEVNNDQQMHTKDTDTSFKEDQLKMDSEAATQARIQQILDEIPKQKKAQLLQQQHVQQQQTVGFNKFKCEWCSAEFINLTAVYKHASVMHPIQLKEQDVSMSLAYANLQASKNQNEQQQHHQTNSSSKTDNHPGDAALQILKQQIAEKRNHQLAEKINHIVNSNPKLQEVLNKRLEEDMNGGKRFQCDKCTFSTSNQSAFQNHSELHGTKFQTQCWFCEYSVNSMEILYQHMKISHTRKWKQLSQDPRYANQIQRMNLAFANGTGMASPPLPGMGNMDNNNDLTPTSSTMDSGVMDLSSKKAPTDMAHDIVYVRKPQYTWSGIPVNVVPDGTALKFVCPKCSFNDAAIAKTCSHVIQSHRAMSKFNCTRCQFSDDNIHVMSDHCKTCHPIKERIVEVLDFKQLNFTELQMFQLNAMKVKASQDSDSETSPNKSSDEKPGSNNKLSCPFCPFKTDKKEVMKSHVSNHSQNAKFRCQICDFSSNLPNVMAEHVKVHETNYDDQNGAQDFSHANVKSEKETQSQKEKPSTSSQQTRDHAAENCKPSTSSASNEVAKAPSPKARTPGRIRYRCSICPYHTTCKSNIFKHRRQHNLPKRYKCEECSYSAARAVLLKKHINSHRLKITNEDGYYHDIFYDPNSMSMDRVEESEQGDGDDAEQEDGSEGEEDSTSDDLDNEMNTKAIADLEAKYIMEVEAAHKASSSSSVDATMDESESTSENNCDKQQQLRKQNCPDCPFKSNSVYEFQKHLNFHGTQERYKCDYCTYSIDRFNLLTQHRKLHINDPGYSPSPVPSDLLNTSFILQQSEMTASTSSAMVADGKDHPNATDPSFHQCASCPFKTTDKKSFDIHNEGHGQRKRFICDFCDWSADLVLVLHQHRKVHENEPGYKATPVDSVLLNKEYDDGASGEFEAKFMEVVDSDKQLTKEGADDSDAHNSPPFKLTVVKKSYPCKLCPYKTNSKHNYQSHKNMHSSDGKFSCSECSFSTVSLGLLRQHALLHSSSDSKSCSSSSLENTVNYSANGNCDSLSPSSQAELTCQRCPFTASSIIVLAEHVKGHNVQDKQLLSCPYCDFRATTTLEMYPHIQVHFPGTRLQPEAMAKMLEEHFRKINNSEASDGKQNSPSSDNAMKKSSSLSPNSQVIKTKIYVCQYCEREFEAKSLMIQHEKQHLVGSH